MAITDIQSEIESIAGISSSNTKFIESAQRFVCSSVPKNYMWAYAGKTVADSSNPITVPKTDSILAVTRGGHHCAKIEQKYRGMVESADTASLYYPTKKHPKYTEDGANEYRVYPAPTSVDGMTAQIIYVDYSQIDDTSELRNAVIYSAVSKEFAVKVLTKVVDWTGIALPSIIAEPDFGENLTISTTSPIPPSIDKTILDTTSWVAPSYIAPSLQLADFPTITWDFPSSPVAPSIASNSIADWSSATPSFVPPPAPSLDFSSVATDLTNEDPEMVSARNQMISAQVNEYQAKMQESQALFNKDNAIFQATVQTYSQEAQLLDANENRQLQKFGNELQKYQADVGQVVQSNQAEIQSWSAEAATRVQNYQAHLQSALNSFNSDNTNFQSEINKSIQNATFEQAEQSVLMQKFQSDLNKYQQDINKEVGKFTQDLNKNSQEYGSKLSRFQAELGKQQAEMAKIAQEIQAMMTQASLYEKESAKYYSWATGEIQKFIQNNERTTSRALTQQALQ
jgi:hypothetical protein